MRTRFALLLLGSVLGACDCGTPALVELEARPALVADNLDFGEVPVGAERTLTVTIGNDGSAPLAVSTATLEPPTPVFATEVQPNPVPPRTTGLVVVRFMPLAVAPYQATATLATNAERGDPPSLLLRGSGVEPLISVDPNRLDFGNVAFGETRRLLVHLHNARGFDQSVSTRIEGSGALSFALTASGPAGTVTVPAFSSIALDVVFGPRTGGAHEAQLRLDFCGTGCGHSVALLGRCDAPRIVVEPLLVDLGMVGTGEQATGSFTVRNSGLAPLTIDRIELVESDTDFQLPAAPPALVLAAGEGRTVEVLFAPLRSGEQTAQVAIASDDPAAPQGHVALIGRRSGSDLIAVPARLEFGVVSSAGPHVRSLLLVNRGDEPANVLGVVLDGAADFALSPPLPVPFAVAGGVTAAIDVAFAPATSGSRFATLQLATDVAQRPLLEVALAGTLSSSACALVPSADAIRFGNVLVGSRSLRTLTVANAGNAACGIAGLGFSPVFINDAAISFTAPELPTLDPGAAFAISIVFAPDAAGPAKAVLAIQSSDPAAPPVLVGISGAGARSGIVAAPPSLDFGRVVVDCDSRERLVSISNVGSVAVGIEPARLDPAGSAAFAVSSGVGVGYLAPGQSRLIGVRFAPTVVGIHSGALIVDAGADVVGVVVPLTGEAVPADQVRVTENFEVAGLGKVDILFVVDNSGSMYDNQQNLAANFSHFIAGADFRGMQVDFQIGVTTTDADSDLGARGRLVSVPKILTRNTPGLESQFASSVRQGTDGSGWEQGLGAAFLALSPPLIDDPAYNKGLLRTEAALAVVVVSDEDDQSPQPVAFYDGFLSGLKAMGGGPPSPVLFNAVTGGGAGCQSGTIEASPAPRYSEMVAYTGGRSMNICTSEWGAELESLGSTIFLAANTRFQLTGQPDASTIEVRVNGVLVPGEHYRYDAGSRTIVFERDHALAPGDAVEVSYVMVC